MAGSYLRSRFLYLLRRLHQNLSTTHTPPMFSLQYQIIWIPLLLISLRLFTSIRSQPDQPKGCRRLGLPPHRSNLRDEYSPRYNHGGRKDVDKKGQSSWRIKALFTYPIKSCAGVELDTANVVPTGLLYDRLFCFAECVGRRWDLRTLRDGRFSNLALIRPEIWVPDAPSSCHSAMLVIKYPRVPTGRFYLLKKLAIKLDLIPGESSFRIPVSPPDLDVYPSLPVKIWKDSPLAYDYGQHLPQAFRDFVNADGPITLFRVNDSHLRQIFRNAPRKKALGFQPVTGFADAYPIHLLNLSSVRDVASRCAALPQLSIRRFRPNIVIQGPGAFEEDRWKRIRLSRGGDGVEVHTVCRTVRCRLPNVDPDTGIRHPSEPDRTLKSYRRIDPGCEMFACLGMQLVPSVEGEFLPVC